MAETSKLNVQAIDHVGIVVKDVEKAAERYSQELGIGPWKFMTIGPGAKKHVYCGEPSDFTVRIAQANVGSIKIELLEPLYGRGPHQAFLDERGEGIQHLGIHVEDFEEAAREMERLGYREVMASHGIGPTGEGAAAYYDAQPGLGAMIEISMVPGPPPAKP